VRPAHLVATPVTADLLRGALEVEATSRGVLPHRLTTHARRQNTDPGLALAEAQPSGVRLVVRTRATVVELEAHATRRAFVGAPPRPLGVYDLLVDGEPTARGHVSGGSTITLDMTTGATTLTEGDPGTVRFDGLPAHDKTVEIWLPHTEVTEVIALHTDAPVEPGPASDRPVWVHHGSSVSHGSDAASPSTTWPAVAARLGGVDLVNLGFGGGALLDPFTARAMRDTPADLLSVKVGINIVNLDGMRLRTFTPAVDGFLDTIREGHPTPPLLVVTPLLCPIHEDTPGPAAPDWEAMAEGRVRFRATGDPAEVPAGRLTLRVIRQALADVVARRAAEDPHLHLVDGLALYGEADHVEHPLPDALHPDAVTHQFVGERFAAAVFGDGGPFAVSAR
jgi:hypothetical protein